MKTRTSKTLRRIAGRHRFALHPLSFAICLGLSGAALALPQGGSVVSGEATITRPTSTSEVIRQTTDKAIIDWRSFSIGAGERVRFYQPSSTSVTLNRVTGYDPSSILGQMSSNGKIFLLNPYGVVFGADARIDVGGLVVSTLSMANNDFLAGRYSLTSVDPAAPAHRGAIVNEGTISAPGGTVVLAGPSVTNAGTIAASGGRVGLVAANAVSVDVEGDGLLFFQTSASEAGNRLAQLGRIQADGGTVEMRAAARGAFADTVLNMAGVVQAKTLGSRDGRIVVDGGSDGVTAVSGQLDASGLGAGQRGGAITVEGRNVLLDTTARLDASGSAGGGAIRVGGDFHGANPDIRNADRTVVLTGAELHADAVTRGDGGSVVVWADENTRYYGSASARGGAEGGAGGRAEVSGKQSLLFSGNVDLTAPRGAVGELLLDPTNFTIAAGTDSATLVNTAGVFTDAVATASTITPTTLQNQLALSSVVVDTASALLGAGTILVTDPVAWASAFNLTLKATTTITVNGSITNTGTGGLNFFADGGAALNAAVQLAGGGFQVAGTAGGATRAASFTTAAGGTINTTGANRAGGAVNIATTGAISTRAITTSGGTVTAGVGRAAGTVTLDSSAGSVTTAGAITANGSAAFAGSGLAGGAGGAVTLAGATGASINAGIATTGGAGDGAGAKGAGGAISLTGGGAGGISLGAGVTVNADDATITANGGGGAIQLASGTLTTTGNVALTGVGVSQTTGTIVAGGATTVNAGSGSIDLQSATNNFTGAVTLTSTGANAAVRDVDALTLGTLAGLGANTGLTAIAGTTLTVPGTAISTGTGSINLQANGGALATGGTLTTSTGSISLTGSAGLSVGHDITSTSGNIALSGGGAGGLAITGTNAVDAGSGTIALNGGGGAIDLNNSSLTTTNTGAAAVTVRNASTVQLGTIAAGGGGVVLGVAGDVTGAVTQNAARTITADTLSVSVGAASVVTLDNNNAVANLGPVTRGGSFTLKDVGGGLTFTGSVSDGAANSDVAISTTGGALALGNNSITTNGATGDVTLTGVGVTQGATSTLTVGGVAAITGGAGAIDLQSTTNDFKGNVTLSTASTAAVRDANALALTSVASDGITAIAGTTLSLPAGSISSTGGDIVLQALGGTLATTGTITNAGGAITLTGAQGLTVGDNLSSGGGAISLTGGAAGGLSVTNGTVVDAGAGTIAVNGGGSTVALGTSTLTTTNAGASAITVRNATTVVLGNLATGAAGTTTLGVAGDIGGAVTQTAATQITSGTLTASTAGSITLDKANALTNLGPVARGGAFTLNDAGGLTLTGSVSGGTSTANAVAITTTGLLALGANDITATTGAGNVTLNAVGVTQTAGSSITAAGTTTVNAGAGIIDLQSTGNDFAAAAGSVALNATGASVAIRDANNLGLATPTLGANTSLTAIAGGALALPAGAINVGSGSLDLRSLGGALSTPGDLSAANIALTGSAGITLADNLSATTVALNTTNANVTQAAGKVISATGATTFATGTGAVTLGQNNLLGSFGGTGGAVTVSEASAGGIALDAMNVASLAVTTTTAAAPVTQNGPLTVSGATTINAGTGTGVVTLLNPGNDFNGFAATAGAVGVADANAIVLGAITAPSLTVNTSAGNGTVSQSAALNVSGLATINAGTGTVSLLSANQLGSFAATGGAVSLVEGSGAIALGNVSAASLSVDTSAVNGVVTQSPGATLAVTGATSIAAGTGDITIGNAGNTMGSVAASGGTVLLRDSNALTLGAINATSLTVDTSAGNGPLTQSGAAIVTGSTVVTTGTGAIALTNPGNDFVNLAGNSFTGGAISLRDTNDLTVTTLANGTNQAVSVIAGGALTLPGGVTTGAADLTLSSGTVLTTPGVLSGNNVTLAGAAGIGIGANVTATGNLNLSSVNAPITQSAGSIVSGGTTTVTAGTGAVQLAQAGNDFNSVAVVSGSTVTVNDSNALSIAAAATGNLTVTSTGALSTSGTVSGANIALTGNAGITLGNNVNTAGALQLTTTNAAIDQTAGAVVVGGATTVTAGTGDITLNQAGNDFNGIVASGGAVRLRDANNLVITSLANGANKDLSLTAGNAIVGVTGNIDTGSADLTIAAGGGFTSFGNLRGTNVTVGGGTGGITLLNNVTALGNLALNATNAPITQSAGTVTAAGTTTANAGTGNVSLTLAGNNFATFGATGTVVAVRDDNGLTLGAVNATTLSVDSSAGNGAIGQSGAAVVSGNTTLSSGSGAVTLGNAGNDFSTIAVSGGAVSITDANALALGAISATSLTVNTSAGNGPVSQTAAATVVGATSVSAGTGSVALTNAGNNFGSVGAIGGGVSVTDINALALDAITATSLNLIAGGPITQNGAAVVSGATLANAGANAITLNNAGNNFGSIGATAGALSITDSNALALDVLNAASLTINTAAGNGNVTQNAAATISGATAVNAGTGAVTLTNAGNNFSSVAATGGAVSITDINALALGAIGASSLSVNTAAGNGAVTQTGPAVVSGASTVNAGLGSVSLANAGNDFATLSVTGGAVTVVDANALTLTTLTSAPNQAVSVSAGGALLLPATAIDTGTASLTLSSGGPLTTVGTLRGTNVALASGGTMTLANDVTALGSLGLTSANAPIVQTGGRIVASGTTTVNAGTGDIALAQLANDFQGNVLLTGGAVSARDTNNLTVSSLASGTNKPVSLIAGGTLVLPATPIDTGSADLTLQALGGSLVINGTLNGNNLVITGSTGLTLGANITSTGDQVYTSPVTLGGNVTLNSGSSKIDLQGGANGVGNSLTLVSSNVAADAIHTGAPIVNTAQFTVNGNATLGGNVTTSGTQTYAGPVVLGTDLALNAGAAKIDLGGAVDAGGHALTLVSTNAAADAIRARATIGNAAQLTVTGKSTLASGITTSGAQLYSDTVSLSSNSDFTGSSLSFGNGISAGAFDLGLRADALTLNGTIAGTGNATLSAASQNATVGVAGGAGTLQYTQAMLDKFSTFTNLTIGRADGTGNLTFGNLVLPTNMAVLSGSGNANFTGTVASAASQSRNLSVTTGGTTTFGGAVGGAVGGTAALGNLNVAGTTALNAGVVANGNQTFTGAVTVGADATLSASAVSFGASLDVGTHALSILSDAVGLAGTATGSGAGSVRLAPKLASGSTGVAGGAGTLQVSQATIDAFSGVPTLQIGRTDGTGTVTVGSLVLPNDLAITNGSGNVVVAGTVNSAAGPARDLTVATTGTTTITGVVGGNQALDVLTVTGASQLGSAITTSGAQTYAGAATLVADSVLSGPSVSFGSSVDGGHALTVNAGATQFASTVGGASALTSLTTNAAGTTQLGGNVTTSGAQTYNDALRLNADTVLTGSTLTLAGTVDGARNLTVAGSTAVSLGAPIGGATPLSSLTVSGPLQLSAGTVTTTGAQSYGGATTLGGGTTLAGSSILFGNTLDGGFGLVTQSGGLVSFAGAVGSTAPLASLAANGGGAVQLTGPSIRTTGGQSYSGALQVANNARLTGSNLAFAGAVTAGTDLTLQTDGLTGGTSIAGTGVLTIAPVDPTLSIGVAGGAGTLQIPQAVLGGASGFSSHVIGRSDGSGTVTSGPLVLRADTTLQTGSGDITLGGSVDGAFALALNSGGTTRLTGPIGVGTALKSLTTDNNATAADWNGTTGERTAFDTADSTGSVRVVTTGAQTYNDPVTSSVPIVLTGGAITASQATNRFDGTVSATATTLTLRNSTDLQLGAMTLLNGGDIDADGVVHIGGALHLNGGTLVLTSRAVPTPGELTDPEYAGKGLSFGFVPVKEASATIVQEAGGSIGSAAGSLLVLRSPGGGSMLLDKPGNALLGDLSAVSGRLGDNDAARFNSASTITLGLIRIDSTEVHVAGRPPTDGNQALQQAGLEGDVVKITADVLTTGTGGLIRARLPFNNTQGSQTSLPGLTFVLSPAALVTGTGFGTPTADSFIQISVGATEGGFITARPNGASGNTAVIFLGGDAAVRPFYDGNGKLTEIRIFYNGDAPRTPQEAGALAAVIALIEEARHARFDEAVRTENVSSRLRSGVIAEVGAGRPATVGRESIRLPDTCDIKGKTLECQ